MLCFGGMAWHVDAHFIISLPSGQFLCDGVEIDVDAQLLCVPGYGTLQCMLRNITFGNSCPRALSVIASAGHRLTPAAKELWIIF